jgi:hypothetical protein
MSRIRMPAYFVGGTLRRSIVQPLSVKSEAEGGLDTGAEALSVSYTRMYKTLKSKDVEYIPRAKTPALLILALINAAESR